MFALATLRGVHLGLLMLVAACAVGPILVGMSLGEVVAGFPVSILILVAGVNFFFGIAHLNGTLDRVMGVMLARTGEGRAAMPLLFFLLAAIMAAMGSPQAGLATGPAGMSTARRARVDPVLMAIAINSGICAGAFAPTSLFGIITYDIARRANIGVTTSVLLAVSVMANLALLAGAMLLFSRRPPDPCDRTDTLAETVSLSHAEDEASSGRGRMRFPQLVTVVCLVGLVPGIVGSTLLGLEPDIGVVLLTLGACIALLDPSIGARAFARIDWSTAFVVGGIVTYVGVLQRLDAVNLLGRQAMTIGTPFAAALVTCTIAALVSAFASTTGVLAALVPMAVPLATSGAVPGWALITALGVSATIVDASPFSNTGATLVASAPEEDRPRLRMMLLRWSMAMVLMGPIVVLPALLALARSF